MSAQSVAKLSLVEDASDPAPAPILVNVNDAVYNGLSFSVFPRVLKVGVGTSQLTWKLSQEDDTVGWAILSIGSTDPANPWDAQLENGVWSYSWTNELGGGAYAYTIVLQKTFNDGNNTEIAANIRIDPVIENDPPPTE